jgi:hypothetical protein
MLQKAAWALIGFGSVILVGWGLWEFALAEDVPILVRVASVAVGVGFLILIGIVVRDRMKASETDQFKEVQR